MARKIPYLQELNGRFYARIAVPARLRDKVGKRELKIPLGPDRRKAKDLLPAAVAQMKATLARYRSEMLDADRDASAKELNLEDLARLHYRELIDGDLHARNRSSAWAQIPINDLYVEKLRQAEAGQLNELEMLLLLRSSLEPFYNRGLVSVDPLTTDGRQVARAIASAELAALEVVAARDEGIFENAIDFKRERVVEPPVDPEPEQSEIAVVSIYELFESYTNELARAGRGTATKRRWAPVFNHLVNYLKASRNLRPSQFWQADDARRLTKRELVEWKEELLKTRSPKTVKSVWVAAVRAVLGRAAENDILAENVAATIKVRVPEKSKGRESGFTDEEATEIIRLTVSYQPETSINPATREAAKTTAARRWGPVLCAFSGARVSEMMQLRKSDVREKNGIPYVRITPEAGSVKTGKYRDVPIHQQLIDLGFLSFVEGCSDGHLFCTISTRDGKPTASSVADNLAKWLRKKEAVPPGVAPNHGWRHRFKTQAMELGLEMRVVDAIAGHSARTAGEDYGDVTLAAKARVIDQMPTFALA